MKVLMVEDNSGDVGLVREALVEAGESAIDTVSARTLREASERLAETRFDAVLLDLGLPDACGLEGLTYIADVAPDLPIVVLSGLHDDQLALQAVQLGAQDFLVKDEWDGRGDVLARVIRYAIERKHSEQYFNHLAYHDGLTDLPNRRLFLDRLAQALARARRSSRMLAVVFIDLDRFKEVNDTMGHAMGDQLLREVAARLRAHTRASDTVARVGGDEFTVILPDITRVEDVMVLADKLLETLRAPITGDAGECYISASLGISVFPNDADVAEALLARADEAMYRAKQDGRNLSRYYEPTMNARAFERFELGQALSQAIERQEMRLHFQPLVNLRDGTICGLEALLRWEHPELGLLGPYQFLRFAETSGLILAIGEWVVREAAERARAFATDGRAITVWVNVSERQLDSREFLGTVSSAVKASGLGAGALGIELSEAVLMRNGGDETAAAVRALHELGVRVAIDDFGLGLSSLRRLRRFPVDAIKIDRMLVAGVPESSEDAAIASAIIAMAHGLGVAVSAEGVESDEQLAFLRRCACDSAQGHLFSPAMPARDTSELLASGGAWRGRWSREP
jgi:diguanylate cyclase (GGDEF)-like protein